MEVPRKNLADGKIYIRNVEGLTDDQMIEYIHKTRYGIPGAEKVLEHLSEKDKTFIISGIPQEKQK